MRRQKTATRRQKISRTWLFVSVCYLLASCSTSSGGGGGGGTEPPPSPLEVSVDHAQTQVQSGTVTFDPKVTLTATNAVGAVVYTISSDVELAWFRIDDQQQLAFVSSQQADYQAPELESLPFGPPRETLLTVTATDTDPDRTTDNTAQVQVRVMITPAPLQLEASTAETHIRSGTLSIRPSVSFSAAPTFGTLTYGQVQDDQQQGWFEVSALGVLRLKESITAGDVSYAALTSTDAGMGKPIRLTISADDQLGDPPKTRANGSGSITVTVHVTPPPFELSASPPTMTLPDQTPTADFAGISVTVTGGAEDKSNATYSLRSEPADLNWFGISESGVITQAQVTDYSSLPAASTIVTDTVRYRPLVLIATFRDPSRPALLPEQGCDLNNCAEISIPLLISQHTTLGSDLRLAANKGATTIHHGSSADTGLIFTPSKTTGNISYKIVSPPVNWFALRKNETDQTAELVFAQDKQADYFDIFLTAPDQGDGRPVFTTVEVEITEMSTQETAVALLTNPVSLEKLKR